MGHFPKPINQLLVLSIIFTSSCFYSIFANDSDKSALLEFKSAISDPTRLLRNWVLTNLDHNSWVEVMCDLVVANSRILAINITGAGNFCGFTCDVYDQFLLYGFGIRKDCVGRNGKLNQEIFGCDQEAFGGSGFIASV